MKSNLKSKKPSLSLCMIVKNEEEYLQECLESVEDVVDEIILVDTGSTDRTVEIAKQFDAEVYHIPWHDDFAAARNESIKHASGDWILQLDADERLDPESKKELRHWLENNSKMCISVLIDSPKEENNKGHISRAHRLFRNLPGIQYSGRIHEQISPSVSKLKGEEGFTNIKVMHLGYNKSEVEMQAKSERNFLLLKRQLAEEPNNAYYHFTLAQNLILQKEYQQALTSLNTALKLGGLPKDIRCSIYNNLTEVHTKLGKYEEAVQFAAKAISLSRNQTTSYLLLYEIYGYLDNPLRQIDCLESVLDITGKQKQSYNEVSLEAYVDETAIYINLGNRYLKTKKLEKAHNYFQKALEKDGNNFLALTGKANSFLETGDFQKAQELFERVHQQAPDDFGILEKLGWLAIKLQNFHKGIEIYEKLLTFHPENFNILKRLAALYSKTGNLPKSKEHLLRLKSI